MTGAVPTAIVVTSSTPLWYTTRATGLVALVLLTGSMGAGLLSSVRFEHRNWPRFVTLGLHRNLSLLALAFTVVHVLTTVLDSFVSIPLVDAVIPFIGSYRPFWLGLGAIAFDLMLALIVTSLARARMGLRSWRLVHWTAYACWPIAVVHGLGTGSDTSVRWVLALTAACVLVVVVLTLWRLALSWPQRPGWATAGVVLVVLAVVAGGAWLRAGPLAPNWGARSGTHSSQPRAASSTSAGASR
ncbi:MAG TPA: ferric reductase-like transmembrane domain-containing protein [Streptosporangiaceae bacterium]|nr:ferric reductase-like transmembrane domain-containing protein [Streptosporangiaceae bacterium]